MEIAFFIMELVGTAAFALSGAMEAMKHRMDVLGVVFLGLTTAVGGGIIRDLMLGITPPRTFQHPVYAMIAILVSVCAFLLVHRQGAAVHLPRQGV